MKEILIIVGIPILYILIGEFLYGFSTEDFNMPDDIFGEIVCVVLWPIWTILCIWLWFVFKVIDPIIGHPFELAKKLGRKLGEKIWRQK